MGPLNRALHTIAFCLLAFSSCNSVLAQNLAASEQPTASQPGTACTGPTVSDTEAARAVSDPAPSSGGHRMFWVIPNAKAQPISAQVRPLSTHEKWNLVKRDALDPSSALTAVFVGGMGMALDLHHEFGWGASGAAKYGGAAFAGQEVSKVMTGGVLPTLFHQDPRFFTRGTGSASSRVWYAISREFVTRGDNGHRQFNFSELGGVGTAALVGNAYYTSARGAGPTAVRFGEQIGINAGFNVLKEFWPSIQKRVARKK